MNQRERDKFPKIYELMDLLYKYDCDKEVWDKLNIILQSLEPRSDYEMLNDINDKLREAMIETTKHFFEVYGGGIKDEFIELHDFKSFKDELVNYTKPLEKPLKRAFIVVIGLLWLMYHNGLSYESIDWIWKEWLEYKKNEDKY